MNFDKIISGPKLKLVDFWAPWCRYCILLEPTLDQLEKKYEDLEIVKVNVDENPEIAQKFGVRSLPTLKFFKDGELIKVDITDRSIESLSEMIENNL